MTKDSLMILSTSLLSTAVMLTTACQSGRSPASSMLSSSVAPQPSAAQTDYTKPYLTDEKMQQFLASMKEERNPFELMFKKGGGVQNPAQIASRMEEFNSFARKYNFQDYQDYTAVWGRITAGEVQIWGADMIKDSVKTFQKTIDDAQADLKKPNLSPEQRQLDEGQIATAQKTISDLNTSEAKSALNEADLSLVQKYKDQIDAAEKKYKAAQ